MNINQGKPCHISNYTKGRNKKIRYIVIHFTSNDGDTAKGNCNFFSGANRESSAHYFVDEKGIYQSVQNDNTAWHCGSSKYKHLYCRNSNSIGVEMCSRKDDSEDYYIKSETVSNTIELTKYLMKLYNIPLGNILRHYDVTGKVCPEPFVRNENLWVDFKNRLKEEEPMTEAERLEFNELKQNFEALKKAYDKHIQEKHFVYDYMDKNMPDWCKPIVQKGLELKMIKGVETDAKGNVIRLGLTMQDIKALAYDLREQGYKV